MILYIQKKNLHSVSTRTVNDSTAEKMFAYNPAHIFGLQDPSKLEALRPRGGSLMWAQVSLTKYHFYIRWGN